MGKEGIGERRRKEAACAGFRFDSVAQRFRATSYLTRKVLYAPSEGLCQYWYVVVGGRSAIAYRVYFSYFIGSLVPDDCAMHLALRVIGCLYM